MFINVKQLGLQNYLPVWEDMKSFTQTRQPDTQDELWLVEHPAVYTQGQAGKTEHILNPKEIPIVQSDRGGQVTYHGPGQMVAYVLLDLKRRHLGVRTLVCELEGLLIDLLTSYHITAHRKDRAPGVYVAEEKIASLGLRIKNNCSYHGLALNVDLDLEPFDGIHPCGYQQLKMTRMTEYDPTIHLEQVQQDFIRLFLDRFTTSPLRVCDANLR